MKPRNATLTAIIFLIAACSDPTGPCDGARACEVTGIDLAIIDARIVEGERTGTDHVTGLPVYRAGAVTVEFTIVNRGDSISEPQPLALTDFIVPPLAPGETARVRISEDFTSAIHLHPSWFSSIVDPRQANQRRVRLTLLQRENSFPAQWPPTDSDPGNNVLDSPPFHVAMPVLTGSISTVGNIRENTPFVTSFRIENVSVHGADAAPFDVVLCLWDFDLGCYGTWWTSFGRFEVPGVEAGWRYENAYLASLDAASMVRPREASSGSISLCIVARDHASAFIPMPPTCIASREIITRPDYERCEPAVLQIGVPHTMAQANCGDFGSTSTGRRFSVLALDAVAGRTYIVDGAPPYLYNANGENADLPGPGLAVAESGRYYLAFDGPGPITITVTESD